jgi:hypothetical protein
MTHPGLSLEDETWSQLRGGYRQPYDPRGAFRRLEQGDDFEGAWLELWENLHHQGDVGDASYAAVPHLVRIHAARRVPDWNVYALVAVIEESRLDGRNPPLPARLRPAYEAAWRELATIGCQELVNAGSAELVCSIIGVIAMAKGQRTLGRLAATFTEDELREMVAKLAEI